MTNKTNNRNQEEPTIVIKKSSVTKASEVMLKMKTEGYIPWGISYFDNGEWSQCFVKKGVNV